MRLGKLLCTASILLMSANVFADSPRSYFGIFISDAQFDPDKGANTDFVNLNFKLGYDLSSYLGAELRVGSNATTDNNKVSDTSYAAALVRGDIPLKHVNLYGLVGFGAVTADTPSFDDSYSDLAYGLGIEMFGTKNTAFSIEYVQYGVDDIYKTLGVGIVHHFDWPKVHPKYR